MNKEDIANLDDEERAILAELYPELREKLTPARKAKPSRSRVEGRRAVIISSDEEEERAKQAEVITIDDSFDDKENLPSARDESASLSFKSARSEINDDSNVFLDDEEDMEQSAFLSMDKEPVADWPMRDLDRSFTGVAISSDTGNSRKGKKNKGDDCFDDDDDSRLEENNDYDFEDSFINDDDSGEEGEDSSESSNTSDSDDYESRSDSSAPSEDTKKRIRRSLQKRNGEEPSSTDRKLPKQEEDTENKDAMGDDSFEKYLQKLREDEDVVRVEGKIRQRGRFIVDDDESDSPVSSEEEEEEEEQGVEEDFEEEAKHRESRRRWDEMMKREKNKEEKKANALFKVENHSEAKATRRFVLSLDEQYEGSCHPDSDYFIRKGVKSEKNRADLVARLYKIFNEGIFGDQLPSDMSITFNPRLLKTAGYCIQKLMPTQVARIELSPKVCTTPVRIRDTLVHEMCHAAVFLIDGFIKEHHGPRWKRWAAACRKAFPGFPVPERCHNYKIDKKFTYDCDGCGYSVGRHSKSLKTDEVMCSRCHGSFVLRVKQMNRKANAFAIFVKEHYGVEKRTGASHKEIMQTLSARFKASRSEGAVVTGDRKDEEETSKLDEEQLDHDMSVMSIHNDF